MLETIAIFVLVAMLLFAFLGDLLQYAVRVIASVLDQPNLSTHLVSLSMLLNRFGAAIGLLLIGFFIDSGISVGKLVVTYSVFSAILGAVYLATARFTTFGLRIFRPFITYYYKIEIPDRQHANISIDYRNPKTDIGLIFMVALLGFLLPSVAAAAIPEYRATLLQTGFILNSFATLYSALKIEKGLALTLNTGTDTEKWGAYAQFMYARSIGSFLASAFLAAMLLFI